MCNIHLTGRRTGKWAGGDSRHLPDVSGAPLLGDVSLFNRSVLVRYHEITVRTRRRRGRTRIASIVWDGWRVSCLDGPSSRLHETVPSYDGESNAQHATSSFRQRIFARLRHNRSSRIVPNGLFLRKLLVTVTDRYAKRDPNHNLGRLAVRGYDKVALVV